MCPSVFFLLDPSDFVFFFFFELPIAFSVDELLALLDDRLEDFLLFVVVVDFFFALASNAKIYAG